MSEPIRTKVILSVRLSISFALSALICIGAGTPARAFFDSIFGYDSYEECILDKMQGVTGDLATKQIVYACRKLTASDQPAPPPQKPTRLERINVEIIESEWIDGIMGQNTDFRILVRNTSEFTIYQLSLWIQMGACGNQSRNIKLAQRALNKLGFSAGAEDGVLGEATRNAIKDFQRSKLLSPTGQLDSVTLRFLRIDDNEKNWPRLGPLFFIDGTSMKPNETAYVRFINLYGHTRGREFCYVVGDDVRVPLD